MKIFKISFLVLVVLFGVGHSVALAAQPVITSISPTPARVGDTVTITGTDFVAGSKALIWPTIIDATFVSTTQITFQVPVGTIIGDSGSPNSTSSLYVARPALQGEGSNPIQNMGLLSNRFDINLLDTAPTITSISPTTVHVGDTVSITGTGFQNYTNVQFTDNYVGGLTGYWANLKTFTPTTLSFVVPFGVKGLRTLQVKHTYSGLVSNTTQLTILPIAPILNSIKPTTVRLGVTESFLNADNIDSDSVLMFDDGTQLSLSQCNISKAPGVCFYIPSNMSIGTHTMYIKQKDSDLTSNTKSFTVTDQPVITSVHFGVNSAGVEQLGFMGNGIGGKSIALIDGPTGVVATNKTSGTGVSDLYITFDLSTKIGKGTHTVQLKETDTGKVSNVLSFTVIDDGTPTPIPPLTCTLPQVLVNNICITPPPVCTPPQTLVNNVCTNPASTVPVCTPPQTLVNNVCKTPDASIPPPPQGCSAGNIYNTQTGQLCINNTNDNGSNNNTNNSSGNNNQSSGTPASYDLGTITIKKGSRGRAVMELQRYLNDDLGLSLTVDGIAGKMTATAIMQWQSDNGLTADGLFGAKSRQKAREN